MLFLTPLKLSTSIFNSIFLKKIIYPHITHNLAPIDIDLHIYFEKYQQIIERNK
jgi:hypothetical protein